MGSFGRLIRETTGLEERLAALDALWEVVLADNREHEGEIEIVNDACKAMGLSVIDNKRARARARSKLDTQPVPQGDA